MNYQFTVFEEQLDNLITKTSFAKNFALDSSKILDREYLRLMRVFKDMVVELNNKKKLRSYFNFHQQSLRVLMDKAAVEIKVKRSGLHAKTFIDCLELLVDKMERVLLWMKQVLPDIFNYHEYLPVKIQQSEAAEIQKMLKAICEQTKKRDLKDEFSEMINTIFGVEQIKTFRDLEFWKNSCECLFRTLSLPGSTDEFSILKLLIQLGINHQEFFLYAKSFFKAEIENKITLGEQIGVICFFRKELRVLYVNDSRLQFEGGSRMQNIIKKFLREELLILRALEFANHSGDEAGLMNANYKVSFSVKQLAFFMHLQMETGLIIWQRAKFAHQYIARHFSTVERESISEKSVRNAHYNHAGEDIKKVIAKLSEMLAIAQEKY